MLEFRGNTTLSLNFPNMDTFAKLLNLIRTGSVKIIVFASFDKLIDPIYITFEI